MSLTVMFGVVAARDRPDGEEILGIAQPMTGPERSYCSSSGSTGADPERSIALGVSLNICR